MSSPIDTLQARRFHYIGTRCYNENLQLISCPISLVDLIVIGIIGGLLLLGFIVYLVLTRCNGGSLCRRRSRRVETFPWPAFEEGRSRFAYATVPAASHSLDMLVEPPKIHAAAHAYALQQYRPYDV
uniref:Uncharacterized protein n=1 Tax=Mycena chlorophos TaxID=658473 RepID=A0ABQ0M3B6_MYCCL|nr:predicted protein [Mycena chlorophos]